MVWNATDDLPTHACSRGTSRDCSVDAWPFMRSATPSVSCEAFIRTEVSPWALPTFGTVMETPRKCFPGYATERNNAFDHAGRIRPHPASPRPHLAPPGQGKGHPLGVGTGIFAGSLRMWRPRAGPRLAVCVYS